MDLGQGWSYGVLLLWVFYQFWLYFPAPVFEVLSNAEISHVNRHCLFSKIFWITCTKGIKSWVNRIRLVLAVRDAGTSGHMILPRPEWIPQHRRTLVLVATSLHEWGSGLSSCHAVFYCVEGCGFKFHMGLQFVLSTNWPFIVM